MSQSYVDVNEMHPPIRQGQRGDGTHAARATSAHADESLPLEASGRLPRLVDTRSFMFASWGSLLLLVAGIVLVYHSTSPDHGLLFMLGGSSIVIAVALFLSARAGLIGRFKHAYKAQNLSDTAAEEQARALFDEVMGSRKRGPSEHPDSVIDRFPLA